MNRAVDDANGVSIGLLYDARWWTAWPAAAVAVMWADATIGGTAAMLCVIAAVPWQTMTHPFKRDS